ncbi:hypothetical protein AB0958_13645 [Streptomyces sp. NPDC006655]|uniref:hypothetical protein n=1 Tax=Streptomyces sp. NPDC006655 TaxID=3156898 RepID=UPI0034556241
MHCATDDDLHLIRVLDALRYTPHGVTCSATCRQPLEWHDWETSTAKAMYELLRGLENVLRGAISVRLSVHYRRADWWEAPELRLTYGTRQKIERAAERLRRAGLPVTPEAVVRELTLGFWVALLGSGQDYETQLWRPMAAGFPGYRGRRRPLWERLDDLRSLRNMVAHQEPVGDRELAEDRDSVLTAVGYVSTVVARRMEAADTALPHLLANRPGVCPRVVGGAA